MTGDGKMVCLRFVDYDLQFNTRILNVYIKEDYFLSECTKDLPNILPILPSFVRCNVPSFCTGVTCCIEESKILRRHFIVGVTLDDCNHIMTFQVEQLTVKIQLHNYSFGRCSMF